jgi:hypothetical protein
MSHRWVEGDFARLVPVCRFARARTCHRFAGMAAYGFDPVANKAFYGFRLHLRTGLDGVILDYELAAANAAETELARELAPDAGGLAAAAGPWPASHSL